MSSMSKKFINFLGWGGVVLILLAYILNSFSVVAPQSILYQLLNLAGAIGIIISSVHKKDYEPVVLNIVWGLVAAVILLRLVF